MKLLSVSENGLEKSPFHWKSSISKCAQKSKAFLTFQRKIVFVIVLLIILIGCAKEETVDTKETPSEIKPVLGTELPEPLEPSEGIEVVEEEPKEEVEIPEEPETREEKKVYVEVKKFEFVPSELNITIGTTVVWTNVNDYAHIFKQVGKGFRSPIINEGESFEHTFNKTEVFEYVELNFGARGKIVVEVE